MAGYVQEIHRAYVDQARDLPARRPRRDAVADRRPDHRRRGRRPQPAHAGDRRGARPADRAGGRPGRRSSAGSRGSLRFYDPVVLPDLGLVDEQRRSRPSRRSSARSASARCIYHFVAQPGAGLSGHHATHVGTGLANGHSAVGPRLRDDPLPGPRPRGAGRRAGRRRRRRAPPRPGAAGARRSAPYDEGVREACERGAAPTRRGPQGGARPRSAAAPSGSPPARQQGMTADGGLSSVGNAARLLKAFLSREKEIGVSELARRLDLGKSTVHRLLTTLVQEGLVERNSDTGAYRLGPHDVRARPGRAGRTWTCTAPSDRCSPRCVRRPTRAARSASSTATRSSTSTGSRARRRCGSSTRPAAGCPCTRRPPARRCSRTSPSRSSSGCWPRRRRSRR